MDRQPVEHAPDKWRGELDGLYIKHGGDPIPVTVRVQWSDGTEGEVDAWTSQWTRTHVCVFRETAPPYRPFWVRPRKSGPHQMSVRTDTPGTGRRLDCGAPRRNAVAPVKAEVADVDGQATDVAEDSDGKVPTSRYESLYASGGFGYDAQRVLWMAWAWRHYVKMFRLGPLVPGLGHRPTLLDIPCGDGFWTSVMAHLGFDAQGIDLSSTGVATAKECYPKLNFQKGNAEKTLPVPERSFDVVFSRSITHLHYPDLTAPGTLRMAHNLMRYVKDDGQLLVSYYTKRDGGGTERHHYHPVSDLVRLFEQAGDVWRVDVAGNHVQMGVRHRGWPPPPERGERLAKKALAIRNRFRAGRAISRQV